MMKLLKIFFFLFILFFIGFWVYFYRYQIVINDGTELADERCLKIDPLINKKKQKSFEYSQVSRVKNDDKKFAKTTEELKKLFISVVDISEPWMKKQKTFLNRWDFNFFVHPALKETFYAQYEKYAADLESNKIMSRLFDQPNNQSDLKAIKSSFKKMEEAQKKLDNKMNFVKKQRDFRQRFIKTPPSKCQEDFFYPFYNPKYPIG
jgi:hypothetical protein